MGDAGRNMAKLRLYRSRSSGEKDVAGQARGKKANDDKKLHLVQID